MTARGEKRRLIKEGRAVAPVSDGTGVNRERKGETKGETRDAGTCVSHGLPMATHAANVRGYRPALVQDNAACMYSRRECTYSICIHTHTHIHIRNSPRRLYYTTYYYAHVQWKTGGQVRVRPHTWPS